MRGCRGCDRMEAGFISTYAISALVTTKLWVRFRILLVWSVIMWLMFQLR